MRVSGFLAGLLIFCSAIGQAESLKPTVDDLLVQRGQAMLAVEHPAVIRHMLRNDGFGGPSSPLIARMMLSDAPALVAEAKAKMTIEPHGKGLWLIRFPYVNVALVETRDSLVLIDAGYAAIGPVLRDMIPTLSIKPLKYIVITHDHIDHAYGAKALMSGKIKPQIITSDLFPAMAAKEVRLSGSIGRYNNQALQFQPKTISDLPTPDIVFSKKMTRKIGGETFVFYHFPAETEEQIWVSLPGRGVIFTADYYQGFLPNAGNGKRIGRHIDEWIEALRTMISLKPRLMLPMHGAAVAGEAKVAELLGLQADALDHINEQVIARLNTGERKDRIAASIDWPERFAKEPSLDPQYNRPEDIARMVATRWTGWWDDIPSHFAALNFDEEAAEALRLAGGVEAVDKRARALLPTKPRLAARLADWALFGAPDDPVALQLAIDVYLARIMEKDMPVQEAGVYFAAAGRARGMLAALKR